MVDKTKKIWINTLIFLSNLKTLIKKVILFRFALNYFNYFN